MASGSARRSPNRVALVSTCATFTSTLGSRRTRSKAARLPRRVTSSSAPPSKKSNTARGSRRFAMRRRSSILYALESSAMGGAPYNPACTLPFEGHLVTRLFAIIAASLVPLAALAQAFPTKALRMVVPFTPAGAVDIATRATANEMTKVLGHPVAVENKPGAGGNLGVLDVARSAPDGYSMVMSTSGIQAINPALYAKMPLDVNKELAPVAPIVSLSNVLVV